MSQEAFLLPAAAATCLQRPEDRAHVGVSQSDGIRKAGGISVGWCQINRQQTTGLQGFPEAFGIPTAKTSALIRRIAEKLIKHLCDRA